MAIFELLDYIVNEVGVCFPRALLGFPEVPQGCPCSAESGWDLECLVTHGIPEWFGFGLEGT